MKYTKETIRGSLAFMFTLALVASLAIFCWNANTQTAHAAPGEVLILSTTVSGGLGSLEATKAVAIGKTPVLVTPAVWAGLTTADFASYDAIVLGDPHCVVGTGPIAAAMANRTVWGPAVTGNIIIVGTDPEWHKFKAGVPLVTEKGIAFAVADVPNTGAYITLSCYYHNTAALTPVPLLDELSSTGVGFTVRGVGCFNDAHIVATHPALTGLTDAILSNWFCSVHEAFDSWPVDFLVLAIAKGIGASYTAPDGTVGTPYIMARGRSLVVISDIDLAPLTSTNPLGSSHTVTATVTEGAPPVPVVGTTVTFELIAGPHVGTTGADVTDASGNASFSYVGTIEGDDFIVARFVDSSGNTQTSNTVTKTWDKSAGPPCDLNGDGVVDRADYMIFRSTLGKCSGDIGFIQQADLDGDGCVTYYHDYQMWYACYKENR